MAIRQHDQQRFVFRSLTLVTAQITLLVVTQSLQATWVQSAKLVASDTLPESWAGGGGASGVAISGNTVILGAHQPNKVGPGEAYVFQYDGTIWSQTAELIAADGEVQENFGKAVALEGTTAVVTATGENSQGGNTGAAYVFKYSNSAWQQIAKLSASDAEAGDVFGSDVDLFGDTIVVGADHDHDLGHFTGSAYVFQNTAAGYVEVDPKTWAR